ncbi:N-acyl amino acid synthase FeeM domain-containing protein [Chitinimonas naiadis]
MASRYWGKIRKVIHQTARRLFNFLPRSQKFAVYRSFVVCDPAPSERLQLKIAETQEELEACFALLHDAYVGSGFMKPDPSGMRVTIYHALPTTTTLCAKWDGKVVGTLSLIRDSALGFPLQSIFDLTDVIRQEGAIAEVSALAIHRDFRKTGGSILFPLMKFMYEYCTAFFDTRHLVIAVNPSHIEMYESLLFFRRLTANPVANYDFVNGAPAIGATLDLRSAPVIFRDAYSKKPPSRNLFAYFTKVRLKNIQLPHRRFHITNDPVLTPEIINTLFNVKTKVFASLTERQKAILHAIYNLKQYKEVLPVISEDSDHIALRQHDRFSIRCPGKLAYRDERDVKHVIELEVAQVSAQGFQAKTKDKVPLNVWMTAAINLGINEVSRIKVMALHDLGKTGYGFKIDQPDRTWRVFVAALYHGSTHGDMDEASRFLL